MDWEFGSICPPGESNRRGEEHGSAVWGDVREINRKYSEKDFLANKLMTQNVRISYDSRKHRRNLLTIIIGGSGAGKDEVLCETESHAGE